MAEDAAKILSALQLKDNLLLQLQCPVCLTTCKPPIFMCILGHNICASCQPNIASCPVCRTQGPPAIRNITLEAICGQLLLPCRFKDGGCNVEKNLTDLEEHYIICEFRFKCPLTDCSWFGHKTDMINHCKTNHPKLVIESSNPLNVHFLNYSSFTEIRDIWAVSLYQCGTELFVTNSCYVKEDATLYFFCQYIGPQENSGLNKCKFNLFSKDQAQTLTHVGYVLNVDDDYKTSLNTFEIGLKALAKFRMEDGKVRYTILIEKSQ